MKRIWVTDWLPDHTRHAVTGGVEIDSPAMAEALAASGASEKICGIVRNLRFSYSPGEGEHKPSGLRFAISEDGQVFGAS